MSEFDTTGVNETEVAEQSYEDTGENELESAEPVSEEVEGPVEQDSETNAAFARMRRESEQARAEAEAARRELDELKALQSAREEAVSRLTGVDNGEISALAELTGLSEDEVEAQMESARIEAQKDMRIESLENELGQIRADNAMQADLAAIQAIDPTVKSLIDLGDGYVNYIRAGLGAEDAYWACKARENANKPKPPDVVAGAVKSTAAEKDYYTEAEIDSMSPEQQKANWKKIMASWERNNS